MAIYWLMIGTFLVVAAFSALAACNEQNKQTKAGGVVHPITTFIYWVIITSVLSSAIIGLQMICYSFFGKF